MAGKGKRVAESDRRRERRERREQRETMRQNDTEERPEKKKKKSHKAIWITLLVFFLVIAILLGIAGGFVANKLSMVDYVDINEEDLSINEGVETGYRNIALFGVDSRSNSYEQTRSDCIIIANINEKTKEVKLTSVYRDSYLDIEGRGLDKVTHAYAYGGPELAIKTLNRNLDLDIHEFVTVNFYAVMDIVDAVGGITMDIDSSEIKYINQYIDGLAKETGRKSNNITKTGKQKLDGVQALAFSRIRYTAGGDYKRTERMREVLMAVVEKAKTLNVGTLNKVADKILPEVKTNISGTEILGLLPQLTQYKFSDTNIGWPYEVQGKTINKVWYGVPVDLEANVTKLHQEVFGEEDYASSSTVKSISNNIKNKTGVK